MIEIRPYQNKDYQALEKILKDTELFEEEIDSPEIWGRQIEHDPESILVATEEDRVVGGVFAIYQPWASFIFHLCVEPVSQDQGLGSRLMQEAEKRLKAKGASSAAIYVYTGNERLLDFYKHRGWTSWPTVFPMGKSL
jgi:ribosomal protein S18 acetylase RimI-like enzyme